MVRSRSADHELIKATEWDPSRPAERINDQILMSRGTSNSYLVATSTGDVVINTGMPYQGLRHKERYEALLGRPLDTRKIILTQSHPDHMGGWSYFTGPKVETVVPRNFSQIQAERALLNPFYQPRGTRILAGLMPNPDHLNAWEPAANAEEFKVAVQFDQSFEFELGATRFSIYATPSGETLDSVIVWLPESKTLFTGNLMGALYGALPHFYTPRGDRDRSVAQFLRDIRFIIELEPELLITGHGSPIFGKDKISEDLLKIEAAVRFIHDETVDGMNAQKDLFTLMSEIELPSHLHTNPGRGPVRWYVRAVWEEYAGWFRQESTTELYAVPPRAIWSDLVRLAGGPDRLVECALACVKAGRPVEALHHLDIALVVDPFNKGARRVEVVALRELISRTNGEPYDEVTWLESKLKEAETIIDN